MQAEERDLIIGLFDRLRPFASQPRDPEADRLLADLVANQPSAPYLLTQTVLVQEQALKAAQQRIAELEARSGDAPASGFLSSAPKIGPWGAAAGAAPAAPPTRSPLQAALAPQPAGGGGSFLRSALTTAAGVAGGALLFEGIRGMLSHSPGPFSTAAAASPLMTPDQSLLPPDKMPSDQLSSADLAQDDGAADDYDMTSNDSGFDTDDV